MLLTRPLAAHLPNRPVNVTAFPLPSPTLLPADQNTPPPNFPKARLAPSGLEAKVLQVRTLEDTVTVTQRAALRAAEDAITATAHTLMRLTAHARHTARTRTTDHHKSRLLRNMNIRVRAARSAHKS